MSRRQKLDQMKLDAENSVRNGECERCGCPLSTKLLHVVNGECWKCDSSMNIAIIDVEGLELSPEVFTDTDLELARQHGAVLTKQYSQTAEEECISNTCESCGAMTGSFYLHNFMHLMTTDNGHDAGTICMNCDMQD